MLETRFPAEPRSIALPSGELAQCRWAFPKGAQVGVYRWPLVFFVPPFFLWDTAGDAAAISAETRISDLPHIPAVLNDAGFATFEFQSAQPLHLGDIVALYSRALGHPRVERTRVTLFGFRHGADTLARYFYDFFSVQPPSAMVLVDPTSGPLDLNNITCPYFVLNVGRPQEGAFDTENENKPEAAGKSYGSVKDAVYHHLMRYGDDTKSLFIPDLSIDPEFDDSETKEVFSEAGAVHEVREWLRQTIHPETIVHS